MPTIIIKLHAIPFIVWELTSPFALYSPWITAIVADDWFGAAKMQHQTTNSDYHMNWNRKMGWMKKVKGFKNIKTGNTEWYAKAHSMTVNVRIFASCGPEFLYDKWNRLWKGYDKIGIMAK